MSLISPLPTTDNIPPTVPDGQRFAVVPDLYQPSAVTPMAGDLIDWLAANGHCSPPAKDAAPLFIPGPASARGNAGIGAIGWLVIDFDHGIESADLDVAGSFRGALYSTWTEGRYRLVLELSEPIAVSEWPAFWARAVLLFPGADRSCKDPGRGYFVPSVAPGNAPMLRPWDGPPFPAMLDGAALAKLMPPSVSGEGGHKALLAVARTLRWGLGLDVAETKALLAEHFNPRCVPPWSDREIAHKIREAGREEGAPYPKGWLDGADDGADDGRPSVRVGPDLRPAIDRAIAALAADGCVFQRSGGLVRVWHEPTETDGEGRPTASEGRPTASEGRPTASEGRPTATEGRPTASDGIDRHGLPRIADATEAWLWGRIGSLVSFTGSKGRAIGCPSRLPGLVLAEREWPSLPVLETIAGFPVLRPDGTVADGHGYDPVCRQWRTCDVTIPDGPVDGGPAGAARRLLALVSDFPFKSDAQRAAWLAALLTPLARPAIAGPVPALILDASAPGSGKTLLADLIGTITMGVPIPRRAVPGNPEEWRKAILAIGMAGDSIILFDNAKGRIDAGPLEAAITSGSISDRVLGFSKDITVPVRTMFVITGNQASVSADLARRSGYVRLVTNVERPAARDGFAIPNLLAHVLERRRSILADCFAILRGPRGSGGRHFGGFEDWARVVRDSIIAAGVADPIESQDDIPADTVEENDGDFLRALNERFKNQPFVAGDVLANQIPFSLFFGDRFNNSAIGYRLRKLNDSVIDGLALRSGGKSKTGQLWRIETIG